MVYSYLPGGGDLGKLPATPPLLFHESGYAAVFSGNDKSNIPDECFNPVDNHLSIAQCRFCISVRDCSDSIIYRIEALFPHPGKDRDLISVKKMAQKQFDRIMVFSSFRAISLRMHQACPCLEQCVVGDVIRPFVIVFLKISFRRREVPVGNLHEPADRVRVHRDSPNLSLALQVFQAHGSLL